MPVWAAVVIGLGSGLLGTVLSTVLRIRHERQSELRLRALVAADEYAVAATRVLAAVREAIDKRDRVAGDDDESVEAAVRAVGELEERAMRLVLLLGPWSPATRRAAGTVSSLSVAISVLEDWPPEPDDDAEAETAGAMEEAWAEAIGDAKLWYGFAFDTFHEYIEAASAQLWGRWPGFSRLMRRRPDEGRGAREGARGR